MVLLNDKKNIIVFDFVENSKQIFFLGDLERVDLNTDDQNEKDANEKDEKYDQILLLTSFNCLFISLK